MPQKPPCPSQSIGCVGGTRPRSISSRFTEPNLASNCLQADGADERRHDHRHQQQAAEQGLAARSEARHRHASGSVSSVVSTVVSSAMRKLLAAPRAGADWPAAAQSTSGVNRPFGHEGALEQQADRVEEKR